MAFVIWNVCCYFATNRRGKINSPASTVKPSVCAPAIPDIHPDLVNSSCPGAVYRFESCRAIMSSDSSASSIFPRTDWAELGRTTQADEARLDRLIRLYWPPLRIFLLASFPSLKDQAEVLLQEFAEDKILKKGWLQRADPQRGQFRDFLKTSLRNFVLDRLSRAEVRHAPLPLEEVQRELPAPEAPSEEFDLTWVRTVLAETLRRMEADCKDPAAEQPRRGQIWEMFRIRLLDPLFNDAPQVPYEQLIENFGLKSPTDASNMLLSAKRIFKSHLTRVIKDYAEQDAATAAEIQALEEFIAGLARKMP
jgi:DNA-directed RNA polymerase specialized sigma24 family protein